MSQNGKRIFRIAFLFIVLSLVVTSTFYANTSGAKENNSGEEDNNSMVEGELVSTKVFTNPINVAGADPHVMLHSDGYYYFTRTLGHRLDIWKSRTLTGIDLGERKTVWTQPDDLKDIWAPEIHYLDGKWYIYYTANTGCGDDCRGVYVIENESENPLEGEWVEKGRINTEYPGLDGTVFEHNGERYFSYAAYGDWSGQHGSAVVIAPMSNPWTLNGENVILTYPEYSWEKQGMHVNEGSVVIKHEDKIFLAFSGSACWEDDYSIGLLTASEDSNLLDPESWIKSEEPVFKTSIENGVYGPGHNFFVKSKDGKEDWIVYHGNNNAGDGCGFRPTRMQKFSWNEDGSPDFGVPTNGPLAVPSGEYRIEAEHGTLHKVKLNDIKGIENKTVTLNNTNSSLLIEDINVPEAGSYTLAVRYSSKAGPDGEHYVSVNGKAPEILSYPSTGNKNFSTVIMKVDLKKGYDNKIEFTKKKHPVEIDYIEISGEIRFSIESGAEYKLVNPNGNKVLYADGLSNVLTWDDLNGDITQRWEIVHLEDDIFKLTNSATGKVLAVEGDINEPWANVEIQEWNDSDVQKWKVTHAGGSYHKLINVASGKALDVGGNDIESGANVGTWEDLPWGPAQMWVLYKLD